MERYLIEIIEEETQDIIHVHVCGHNFKEAERLEEKISLGLNHDVYYTRISWQEQYD